MGKGDKKSKRGKITIGSYGVNRKKKSTKVAPTPKVKVAAEKNSAEKPAKKTPVKKSTTKKADKIEE